MFSFARLLRVDLAQSLQKAIERVELREGASSHTTSEVAQVVSHSGLADMYRVQLQRDIQARVLDDPDYESERFHAVEALLERKR